MDGLEGLDGLGGLSSLSGLSGALFGDDTAARVEKLTALRHQRMRLEVLAGEVNVARRLFSGAADGSDGIRSWHSSAGRGYAARRSELQVDLDRSARLIEDALESIEHDITLLKVLL